MRNWLLAAVLGLALPVAAQAETLVVFAASSLKSALDPAVAAWDAQTGNKTAVSYGSSSALAKQIEQGAPADVFLSAAQNWMATLDKESHLAAGTRIDLWGNALSLIAHDPKAVQVQIAPTTDLAGMIGTGKLAMAMVDSVPVGQYGKQALTKLGLWAQVEPLVVQTEDARAALALVVSGEAAYGVVFATDVKAAKGQVVEVARFPDDSHAPIVYPGAVVATSTNPVAKDFLHFLTTPAAGDNFAAQGFVLLAR